MFFSVTCLTRSIALSVSDMGAMSEADKGIVEALLGPDGVRTRLQQAALELFLERGYEQTTAAQIAARVGVTERTFFRYFPDKREILFGGEAVLRTAFSDAIAEAPGGLPPVKVLFHAFRAVLPLIEANRSYSEPWHRVVSATPALRERELAKREVLADALSDALQLRGVDEQQAWLAARIGMSALNRATIAWLATPNPPLNQRLDAALHDLERLLEPVPK